MLCLDIRYVRAVMGVIAGATFLFMRHSCSLVRRISRAAAVVGRIYLFSISVVEMPGHV